MTLYWQIHNKHTIIDIVCLKWTSHHISYLRLHLWWDTALRNLSHNKLTIAYIYWKLFIFLSSWDTFPLFETTLIKCTYFLEIFLYWQHTTCHPYQVFFFNNQYRIGLGLWCLTLLSTIFQLYHASQFYWWRKLEYQQGKQLS